MRGDSIDCLNRRWYCYGGCYSSRPDDMEEGVIVPFISYVIVLICLFLIIDGLDTFSAATIRLKLPRSYSLRMLSIMCASVSNTSATSGFTGLDATFGLVVLYRYYYYLMSNVLNKDLYSCALLNSSLVSMRAD